MLFLILNGWLVLSIYQEVSCDEGQNGAELSLGIEDKNTDFSMLHLK